MNPAGLQANYYFGGGSAETTLTPLSIIVVVIASLLILWLPRKRVVVPFLVAGLLLPINQTLVIAGLHFPLLRVLILVGWARMFWRAIVTRSDRFPGPLNKLDKVFLLWALCSAVAYTILWGMPGALIVKLGFLWNAVGSYVLLRYLVRDREDVIRVITTLAMLCVLLAPLMLMEHSTGHSCFTSLGQPLLSEVRKGRVRAAGPFAHSIIAGTFGAMLAPLFVALWWADKQRRMAAALGLASSAMIAFASSSSTPVPTFLAGILGLCLWRFRRKMRVVRIGLAASLLGLHLVMKAPVWFLIARLSGILGGTGWHRAELIDQFINHFSEWWLIGTNRNAYWGLDMWDCINAFVNAGTEGGLVSFLLFIGLFVCAFSLVGAGRQRAAEDPLQERLIWALGVCVFANAVGFFGITYFDQTIIAWHAVLALIPAAIASLAPVSSVAVEQSVPVPATKFVSPISTSPTAWNAS